MIVRGKSRHELFVGVCLSFGLTLLVLTLYLIDGFEWLERRTYDLRVQHRGASEVQTSILLIENDESTIAKLSVSPSKVSRAYYARAISHLRASGARLIAFDMVFSGRTDPLEDAAMSQAIQDAGNVILARYIGGADHVTSLEEFRVNKFGEGLINLSLDTDGVLRSIPFLGLEYAETQMRPYLTLGAEVARLSLDPLGQFSLDVATQDVAKYGPIEIPYPQGNMYVNFYGPPGTYPSLPLWRAVRGEFDEKEVKDKIVLIGGTAATLHDFYQTPFMRGTAESLQQTDGKNEGRLMSGLEVHANVVQTVLDQSFVHRSSPTRVQLMIAMLGLGCWIGIILYPQNATQVTALSLLLLIFVVGLVTLLFNQRQYWLDVMPFLSLVNLHYGVGMAYQRYLVSRQKEQLRSMFSQYVSPEILDHLWNEREVLLLGVDQKPLDLTVTTLAAKIEGSPGIMSDAGQDHVVAWTRDYLAEIGQLIFQHHGVIEDYAQDGILAHWGIPIPRKSEGEIREDAQNAVRCALGIHIALEKINEKWKDKNLPLLHFYAGICTGRSMSSTVGDRSGRRKFTTIGVPVHMALRLKHLVPCSVEHGSPNILCEAETAQHLDQRFMSKQISMVHVMSGKKSSLLYQVSACKAYELT